MKAGGQEGDTDISSVRGKTCRVGLMTKASRDITEKTELVRRVGDVQMIQIA